MLRADPAEDPRLADSLRTRRETLSAVAEPSPEEIASLAYQYWMESGQSGSAVEHWLHAERVLRQRATAGEPGTGDLRQKPRSEPGSGVGGQRGKGLPRTA